MHVALIRKTVSPAKRLNPMLRWFFLDNISRPQVFVETVQNTINKIKEQKQISTIYLLFFNFLLEYF